MNRKAKRIYVQERLTAKVLQRCRIIKSADNTKTLYYDPLRRRFIELKEKEKERVRMEKERYYPPVAGTKVELIDTIVVYSNVWVKIRVTYDKEKDEIISDIQRLNK